MKIDWRNQLTFFRAWIPFYDLSCSWLTEYTRTFNPLFWGKCKKRCLWHSVYCLRGFKDVAMCQRKLYTFLLWSIYLFLKGYGIPFKCILLVYLGLFTTHKLNFKTFYHKPILLDISLLWKHNPVVVLCWLCYPELGCNNHKNWLNCTGTDNNLLLIEALAGLVCRIDWPSGAQGAIISTTKALYSLELYLYSETPNFNALIDIVFLDRGCDRGWAAPACNT